MPLLVVVDVLCDPSFHCPFEESFAMNQTEQMLHEMNGLLCAVGDEPLHLTVPAPLTELDLLRAVKAEYTARLCAKVPAYRSLGSDAAIPDMFLQALRSREAELEGRLR